MPISNNIIKILNKEIQTFITTTNIEKVDKELIHNCKVIRINNGEVEEEKDYE